MMDSRPMDREGYDYLTSNYIYLLMLPGHQVWYGTNDWDDAAAMCMTEKMWRAPEATTDR